MKTHYLLLSCAVIFTVYSCNQGPKHPQSGLIKQDAATAETEKSIRSFADSIDVNLFGLEKKTSLVYRKEGQSMYVEMYSWNGKPIVYKESGEKPSIENYKKNYYFRNDSLILIKEYQKSIKDGTESFSESQIFLRNNVAFKKENRTATSAAALADQPYISDNKTTSEGADDYQQQVSLLEDAIKGVNQFEMRFSQIIMIPEEQVIQLKGKEADGYTASILIKRADPFIDGLLKNPEHFRNEKLNMNWTIEDKNAYYVPVASKTTSAKGLNK